MDRLTLVELIEAEKSRLSPEALEQWEELDASLYVSPEDEITNSPQHASFVERLVRIPEADRRVIHVLRELRAGLYQSDYSERRGEPSQRHRDECVVKASVIKDRDEPGQEEPLSPAELLGRTVDYAIARLREEY